MNFAWNIFCIFFITPSFGPTKILSQEANTTSTSLLCSNVDNCEACVRDSVCFWCESKLSCKIYSAINKEEQTKLCGEWKWKSCEKPDTSIIAGISAAISVVLILGRYLAAL